MSFANDVAITGAMVTNSNTANLTITGTTTLATSGGFTDSDNTGVTTFVGNVGAGASTSFITTAVTNTNRLVFRGGIVNDGTFTGGGATFNTNNQAITGGSSLSFANNVVITGVTVTNSNTANLTITGTTTLATSGGFTDSDNTGVTTFVGNVGVGAFTSFITTAVTNTNRLVFRGGIANDGTFTAGGATFNTNNQAITGGSSLSFANDVAITGATVTNSNTGDFTIMGTTTMTVSGGFTDSDNTSITTLAGNVSVGASTTFNTTAVTTNANLRFEGGIDNTGTFSAGAARFATNDQFLTGNSPMSFTDIVRVNGGVTVTNNNLSTVTMSRVGAGTLRNSGTWTQGNNSTLNYAGTTMTINTFNATNPGNTVNYNAATSAQTLATPAGSYFNLTINNTFGGAPQINLTGNVSVDGSLTLTQGIVATTPVALLILSDNATTNGGDADSFVDGPIRKIGNDAFVFPTGNGNVWARIGISAPASATTQFTAQYFDANFGDITHDGTLNDPSDSEYWILDRAVTTDGVRVTLYWEDNVRSKIDDAVSGDLVVARYNGTDWTSEGQFSISSAGATGNVTSNVVASFSPFTFGSLSALVNPLPIRLLEFSASVIGTGIQLHWATASELNNDFFTVQRSLNVEEWEDITKVKGAGTVSEKQNYSALDPQPYPGTSYYRLKQTDFDGNASFSPVEKVELTTVNPIQVFPNPSDGVFYITGPKLNAANIKVLNGLGQEVFPGIMEGSKLAIDLRPLAPGLYILKAWDGTSLHSVRMVKK